MYGQLRCAIEMDTIGNAIPSFERVGYGFKSGYRNGNDFAEVSLFHGEDDPNSLQAIPLDNSLLPEENLVLGISLGKMLLEKISIQTEYASSALTRDQRDESGSGRLPFSALGFSSTVSTSYYDAFKASANYLAGNYSVGFGYERIDPGYQTHGAYYFNNDLENITINGSSTLLDSKLNLNASAGLQHDNLDRTKISTMNRVVVSINATYSPSNKISLNGSYSNFQSYTNIRSQFVNINQLTPFDNLDTLQFTQISQSLNLSSNFNLRGNRQKRQMIFVSLSVQDAAEKQGQVEENSGSRFYNVNTSYSLSLLPGNLTFTVSYNLNQNSAPLVNLTTHGPSVSVNKALLERKLRLSFTSAHNSSVSNGSVSNVILNFRGGAAYAVSKSHNFNLGLVAVNRNSKVESGPASFTEYTGTLTYSYSFQ
jgi:hypothetical protein